MASCLSPSSESVDPSFFLLRLFFFLRRRPVFGLPDPFFVSFFPCHVPASLDAQISSRPDFRSFRVQFFFYCFFRFVAS